MQKNSVKFYPKEIARFYVVPLFIKDISREFARPMKEGLVIYLPRIEVKKEDFIPHKWGATVATLGRHYPSNEVVHITEEELNPTRLIFYCERTESIYCPIALNRYRTSAFEFLRHVRFTETIVEKDGRMVLVNDEKDEFKIDLLHGIIAGGLVNGMYFHSYSSPFSEFPKMLSPGKRFPYSKTHEKKTTTARRE